MFNINLGNTNIEILINVLTLVIPFLLCITIHELAHGFTAYRLGDPTAKNMGRLTLNPIKHIDPFGLIMIVLFRFGFAKPVPVNMHAFSHPKGYMAVTAFAGPLSNIILALVAMFIYGLLFFLIQSIPNPDILDFVDRLFLNTISLSVMLAVFNILPIPPLDGSKILFSVLSEENYYKLMRFERFGFIALILLLNVPFFRNILNVMQSTIFESFVHIWRVAIDIVN